MRKLVNDPFAVVDEMLDGIVAAHGSEIVRTPRGRGLVLAKRDPARRVGVIVGGGSGHEPAFFGALGPGLADGAAVGNVFASPSATPAVEVARALAPPDGVLFLFGNYEGDIMNFGMAAELLADEGIASETVLVTDDVVSALDHPSERRGVAGDVIVFKAAGARADEGAGLAAVAAAAQHANDRTRTVGVGLGPCTVPAAGRPTFDLPAGEMDVGMGVHGEAGIRRGPLAGADVVADELLDIMLADRAPDAGESVLVLVNTLGATPLMEGYIVLRRIVERLASAGVPVHRSLVGEYVTSLEMIGLSVTLVHLDDELRRLMDAPARPLAGPGFGTEWR
ncbi:dihydroxyacetone kinase subunit DhaK [Conexibacter woesei]|uniref:Glycerone kinase n=1 Tax=Conexibacter woesei (strain DSM 14684 / CCUG 47730 / CIP 108061 / JCM 11494 / NBRC 100937 / ID131577) TaxID=469383 RepID=D3F988_CONWI|nr:dihydroxyacetone kinase subunit DhaK [Conexibacter woesei]ADB49055.1 Glycerone kinase [Conexibacter woesei DSM 14684]